MRPVGDFPVVAFSLAYELELAGLADCLDMAGIPLYAEERAARPDRHPLVVIGGPLTFSNPVPAAPYADVLLLGEAEETIVELVETIRVVAVARGAARDPWRRAPASTCRRCTASARRRWPLPTTRCCRPTPRFRTPHTELSDMFLIEPERGCHRGCTYCVMRRSTNGGMRLVAPGEGGVAHPLRRAAGGSGGRGGDRPPRPTGDPAPHRRRRARGRHLQPARRPAERRDCRPAQAGRLPDADHRRRRRVGADARHHPAQDQGAAPVARRRAVAPAWDVTVQALHDDRRPRRDRRRHRRAGALLARAGQGCPQGGPGNRALRRQAKDPPRRRGVRGD